MAYIFDTAIISISPPQRGLITTEILSKPPIPTPDGRDLILSTRFLQWLHADQTTMTLYTSRFRPQECDIVIRNVAGHETPFVLLPSGVQPPAPDNAVDPYLTLVSLSVRRALAPPALPTAQPAPAPQSMPPASYVPTPAIASGFVTVPTTFQAPAANIQMHCKANLPYRYRPSPTLFDLVCKWYDFIHGTQKGYHPEHPSITGSDVVKVKVRRMVDAMTSFPWALAAAGVGFVLAVVL